MSGVFNSVISMSISGGMIGLFIILFHLIPKVRFNRSLMFMLWAVVLIRLVVPVSISSPYSIYNFININTVHRESASDISEPKENVTMPSFQSDQQLNLPDENKNIYQSPSMASANKSKIEIKNLFPCIWIFGTAMMLIFVVVSYLITRYKFKNAEPAKDEFVRLFFVKKGMKRNVETFFSDKVSSPLVFGIIKPKLILPKNLDLGDKQTLSHILDHEYAHLKHFDNLWSFISMLVLSVHWFNPIIWVSHIFLLKDIEYGCDERVIRVIGADQKSKYAESLLKYAIKNRNNTIRFVVGFGQATVKERVKSIMKFKKATISNIIVSSIVLVSVVCVFATGAISKDRSKVNDLTGKGGKGTTINNWAASRGTTAPALQSDNGGIVAGSTGGATGTASSTEKNQSLNNNTAQGQNQPEVQPSGSDVNDYYLSEINNNHFQNSFNPSGKVNDSDTTIAGANTTAATKPNNTTTTKSNNITTTTTQTTTKAKPNPVVANPMPANAYSFYLLSHTISGSYIRLSYNSPTVIKIDSNAEWARIDQDLIWWNDSSKYDDRFFSQNSLYLLCMTQQVEASTVELCGIAQKPDGSIEFIMTIKEPPVCYFENGMPCGGVIGNSAYAIEVNKKYASENAFATAYSY